MENELVGDDCAPDTPQSEDIHSSLAVVVEAVVPLSGEELTPSFEAVLSSEEEEDIPEYSEISPPKEEADPEKLTVTAEPADETFSAYQISASATFPEGLTWPMAFTHVAPVELTPLTFIPVPEVTLTERQRKFPLIGGESYVIEKEEALVPSPALNWTRVTGIKILYTPHMGSS